MFNFSLNTLPVMMLFAFTLGSYVFARMGNRAVPIFRYKYILIKHLLDQRYASYLNFHYFVYMSFFMMTISVVTGLIVHFLASAIFTPALAQYSWITVYVVVVAVLWGSSRGNAYIEFVMNDLEGEAQKTVLKGEAYLDNSVKPALYRARKMVPVDRSETFQPQDDLGQENGKGA